MRPSAIILNGTGAILFILGAGPLQQHQSLVLAATPAASSEALLLDVEQAIGEGEESAGVASKENKTETKDILAKLHRLIETGAETLTPSRLFEQVKMLSKRAGSAVKKTVKGAGENVSSLVNQVMHRPSPDPTPEEESVAEPLPIVFKDKGGCTSWGDHHLISSTQVRKDGVPITAGSTQEMRDRTPEGSSYPSTPFYELLFSCGRSTLADAERMSDCIQGGLVERFHHLLSNSCMACFTTSAACAVSHCRLACLLDSCSSSCLHCSEVNCKDEFMKCIKVTDLPEPCTLKPKPAVDALQETGV